MSILRRALNVKNIGTPLLVRSNGIVQRRMMQNVSTKQLEHTSNGYARVAATFGIIASTAAGLAIAVDAKEKIIDLDQIRKEILAVVEKDNYMGPTFVRLAWHSSGTYSKKDSSGGSFHGTIRSNPEIGHGGNAGLNFALEKLEPIKKRHPEISYADLFIYAGVVCIEEMGGPAVPFHLGRVDAKDASRNTPDDRLPNADMGSKEKTIQHVRDVFYRMNFNDREIVALIGAHAVGRCYPSRSGFSGPWTRAEWTFSNEFFRELLENKWTVKKWSGPQQYEDPSKELMMLPSDMAFLWDPKFKQYVEMYAKDEELWHNDFAKAFQKMTENGCNFGNSGWRKYIFFGPRSE